MAENVFRLKIKSARIETGPEKSEIQPEKSEKIKFIPDESLLPPEEREPPEERIPSFVYCPGADCDHRYEGYVGSDGKIWPSISFFNHCFNCHKLPPGTIKECSNCWSKFISDVWFDFHSNLCPIIAERNSNLFGVPISRQDVDIPVSKNDLILRDKEPEIGFFRHDPTDSDSPFSPFLPQIDGPFCDTMACPGCGVHFPAKLITDAHPIPGVNLEGSSEMVPGPSYYRHCLTRCERYGELELRRGCSLCLKLFLNQSEFDGHKVTCGSKMIVEVTASHGVPCIHCNEIFDSKIPLKEHILKIHKMRKIFECNSCTNWFQTNKGLGRHQVKDHKAFPDSNFLSASNSVSASSNSVSASNSAPNSLIGQKSKPVSTQKSNSLICNRCPIKFIKKADLKFHTLIIHDPGVIKCFKCPETFSNLDTFVEHKHFTDDPRVSYFPFLSEINYRDYWRKTGHCTICNLRRKSSRGQYDHFMLDHLGIRFRCGFCPVSMISIAKLQTHQQYEHETDNEITNPVPHFLVFKP